MIETVMRTHSCADWQERLHKAEVPCAPVLDYPQLFAQEQIAARGMMLTVRDK